MHDPKPDQNLVQQAAHGDDLAFSQLVDRYYERALRVSTGLLHSHDDAEDVIQEAFVRAHARLSDFRGESAFYTWLYRIVVNLSIDAMRKQRRERRLHLEEEGLHHALNQGRELWPTLRAHDPFVNVQRQQLAKRLREALNGMSENHRIVLVLREVEGLSYEEISEVLAIKKGTVMSRLFHARRNLQESLKYLPTDMLTVSGNQDARAA